MTYHTVEQLVRRSGVVALPGTATVREASQLMTEHHIGAVLVMAEARLEGGTEGSDPMAINTGVRHASLVGACLLLLASCAGAAAVESRFEAECKATGHAEGSDRLAACVETKWANYRYTPRDRGR